MTVKKKITAVITAFVLSVSSLCLTVMADETNTSTPIPTITPAPTDDINITVDGKTLVKDVDYKLTYRDNINVGTATVVVTFIGNYSGQKKKHLILYERNHHRHLHLKRTIPKLK